MLRHFSTSGDLLCIHTSIVVHRPMSFDIARCHPSSLSDATATRLGIAGHQSTSIVDQCAAMKSECTINVTSFQYKWRLIVHSYFHRCTSADVFRYRSMSPFIAERCHSDKTWHRWASVDIHRRPMHSDEV